MKKNIVFSRNNLESIGMNMTDIGFIGGIINNNKYNYYEIK
jgi:hypothetical protein